MRLFEIQTPRAGEKIPLAHDLDWAHTELAAVRKQKSEMDDAYWQLSSPDQAQFDEHSRKMREINQKQRELEDMISQVGQTGSLEQMPQAQQIWRTIETRCADFLRVCEHSQQLLYRGLKGSPRPAFHGFSHVGRNPKDSDPATSAVFDHALEMAGMHAVRSNSIFVSSNKFQASGYGYPYIIFPVDHKYHYTHTAEKDLVLEPAQIVDMLDTIRLEKLYNAIQTVLNTTDDPHTREELSLLAARHGLISDFARKLYTYAHRLDWNKIQIPATLRSQINPASLDWSNYMDLSKFEAKYHPSNTNLESAMTKHIEIYISGEYYALHDRLWGKFVRQALNIQESTIVW